VNRGAAVLVGCLVLTLVTPALAVAGPSSASNSTTAANTTTTVTSTTTPVPATTNTTTTVKNTSTPVPTTTNTTAAPSATTARSGGQSGGGGAASPASPSTKAGGWSPPGPYALRALRTGGRQPAEAPASVRMLPGGTGAVAVRHNPPGPLSSGLTFLEPDARITSDELQLYSTRFGERIGSKGYTLRIVFYHEATKTVNGTSTSYAADQAVVERSVTLGTGYSTTNVSLPSHYDSEWEATAWLVNPETDEPIPGARWRFRHATVPTSQSIALDSQGDLLWWGAKNFLGVFLIGAIVGRERSDP
jgi:hypothetical protein